MISLRFLALVSALALAPFARATSVVPPTFSELVAESDAIYRARVTTVQARRVAREDGSVVIKTFVTLAIEHTLKGPAQDGVTLEFLGGKIGDESLLVSGMPQFTVGERGIYFVQGNGRQFAPLARFTHGRYRIEHRGDTGNDFVARENHAPLNNVADVELPMSDARLPAGARADTSRALSLGAFEAKITGEIRRATSGARPN